MRIAVMATALSSSVVGLALAAEVEAAIKRPTAIPAQDLGLALRRLATDRDFQIVYASTDVSELRTQGATGELTANEALLQILNGTGLTYLQLDANTVTIAPVAIQAPLNHAPARAHGEESALTQRDIPAHRTGDKSNGAKQSKSFWKRLRLSQAESASSTPRSSQQAGGAEEHARVVEEVIVSARKRGDESLQDVPVSITVIDQVKMEQAGIDNFLDYARTVPGLGFQSLSAAGGRDDLRGGRRVNLRGIDSGYDGNPTVAYYLDETPVPVMDPKLFDVERIEVLRGPQGTLYGANSMGGAIRVVMNKPEQNVLEYRGDATIGATHHGEESMGFNGMLNVPLVEDRLALRSVLFYRDEGGFVDNIHSTHNNVTDADVDQDINDESSWGIRLAAAIEPTSNFRITPSFFRQSTQVDNSAAYDNRFRDLAVLDKLPEREENNFSLYSLELSYSFGNWLLFSSTSYFDSDFTSSEDLTRIGVHIGWIEGDEILRNFQTLGGERVSEELRLSYAGQRWSGVLGAFYMDEDRHFAQDFPNEGYPGLVPGTDILAPSFFYGTQTNGEKQKAVFGEITLAATDRLDITAGLRWFEGEQEQSTRFYIGGVLDPFDGQASDSAISPKLQISYDFDDTRMMYVSASKGFRGGGPSTQVPAELCGDELAEIGLSAPPSEYSSDSLWSYELGTKLAFADGRAQLNSSVFFIDWKDVQQSVELRGDCSFAFLGNAGAVESKGVELEMTLNPTDDLDLAGSVGYVDAQFTESSPVLTVGVGDRLTLVPQWTAALSGRYSFALPIASQRSGYFFVDAQYMDKSLNTFRTETQDAYITMNARLGLAISDSSELVFFIDNVFDERGQLFHDRNADPGLVSPQFMETVVTTRPRSFGVTFKYRGQL